MVGKIDNVEKAKGDDQKRGISVTINKSDFIDLKTLLLKSGETLNEAITRMIQHFIMKKGKLE